MTQDSNRFTKPIATLTIHLFADGNIQATWPRNMQATMHMIGKLLAELLGPKLDYKEEESKIIKPEKVLIVPPGTQN